MTASTLPNNTVAGLAENVAALQELLVGVELDAAHDPSGPAKIAALNAAIAALASPTAEHNLAAWIISNLLTDSQLDVVPPGCSKALRYFTAKQPGSAVQGKREAFIRGYKHGACHYIGGDSAEELQAAAEWSVDNQDPAVGIFTTPPPAPAADHEVPSPLGDWHEPGVVPAAEQYRKGWEAGHATAHHIRNAPAAAPSGVRVDEFDLRLDFELAFSTGHLETDNRNFQISNGYYIQERIQALWEGWQKRAALASKEGAK